MEIKVFKDASKRESTFGGLTLRQWLFFLSLFMYLAADIFNVIYQFIPIGLLRVILMPIIGLIGCNAMMKPHGLKYSTWLKLLLKFQTTIQVRTYQKEDERIKKYDAKDFKKSKKIKETETN
ncbi:PrgI family protein [Enterococcus faecalis]|nr:PrgI family protein [Enterococcus faecalis]